LYTFIPIHLYTYIPISLYTYIPHSSLKLQRTLKVALHRLPLLVTFEAELNKACDEVLEFDSSFAPHHGVHGGVGETGNGVDLVDVNVAFLGDEKIHPGKVFTMQYFISLY